MDEKIINQQYKYICTLIEQRRLKEALAQLEAYLWQCPEWGLRARLEQIQTSYSYMLQYMRQKVEDPAREKLHTKMLADTWDIAEQAQLRLLDSISPHYYHEVRRTPITESIKAYNLRAILHILEAFPDELAVNQLLSDNQTEEVLKRHQETLKFLFVRTWTNSEWTSVDYEDAKAMLQSELLPVNDLCLFISAVTLSLMECFDLRKLLWLMDAYQHKAVPANQRALVGILFIFHIHSSRVKFYTELSDRISYLAENTSFNADAGRIYHQLLLCQETEKINRKLREEIIPEVMKNVSTFQQMRFDFDEADEDSDDKNPDWAEAFEKSGLNEKMMEMNELQLEGADVYMSTFAALKNYPFFKEVHNWLYPFDKNHPSVYQIAKNEKEEKNNIMNLILQAGVFCNSDKYSLFFTIQNLPPRHRNIMLQQMAGIKEMGDENGESQRVLQKYAERPETISNQYLHDLYRFFKLNIRKKEFRNIFDETIELYHVPVLEEQLEWNTLLFPLADFLLKKEQWGQAIKLFTEIEEVNGIQGREADYYQKLGYALQKEKRYSEAIEAYTKADMIKPDHLWTLLHLAHCYRRSRCFEKALEYYRKVESITPDNPKVVFYTASCLVEMKQYEEALQCFFKLDFLEENSIKAWRGIGWCSFILKKTEQAGKYYQKVLEVKPTSVDYMNAGHIAWVAGDIEKAISFYQKSSGVNREAFLELFRKDEEYLREQGIKKDDVSLMLDLLI